MRYLGEIDRLDRFGEIETNPALLDLLWSDPSDEDTPKWKQNTLRNCSYFFSGTHARNFLIKNELKMIIRAHEVVQKGYKYQYA